MNKNYLTLIIVIVILIFSLFLVSGYEKENNDVNRTTLIVSGENGYYSVSEIADSIENHPYYDGYNKTTVEWLKTLEGVAVPSPDGFVIMSKSEADSIPIESVTDVIIDDTISCNIIEKRSLGDDLKNITFVKNVELVSQNSTPLEAVNALCLFRI